MSDRRTDRRTQRRVEAEERNARNAPNVIDCPCGNRHVAGWAGCRLAVTR